MPLPAILAALFGGGGAAGAAGTAAGAGAAGAGAAGLGAGAAGAGLGTGLATAAPALGGISAGTAAGLGAGGTATGAMVAPSALGAAGGAAGGSGLGTALSLGLQGQGTRGGDMLNTLAQGPAQVAPPMPQAPPAQIAPMRTPQRPFVSPEQKLMGSYQAPMTGAEKFSSLIGQFGGPKGIAQMALQADTGRRSTMKIPTLPQMRDPFVGQQPARPRTNLGMGPIGMRGRR